MAKKNEAADKAEDTGFEKLLERLEKIVEEMEAGKLPLEDMISRFEEGQDLVRVCSKRLNEVQKKIEVLVKKGDKIVSGELDEPIDEGAEQV